MKLLFEDILKELGINPHFTERMNERFFSTKIDAFIRYREDGISKNLKIGTYNLQPNVIAEIQKNIDYINNPEVKMESGIVFAIIMHRFDMREVWKGIEFNDDIDEEEILYDIKRREVRLLVGDERTRTYGVALIWIVKDNRLITAMYADTLTKERLYDKLKNGRNKYDTLVALNSPEEIEYYYSGENDDFTALK